MKQIGIGIVILLMGALLLSNCASISQPTGGPKDTIPPVLEFSVPLNGSLNYRGRTIQLKFDEFVKVDQLREQLIITPKYGGEVKSKVNKYTVALELDTKLNDSTTYTFTFREGIKDITESNAPKNLYIAFSTGNYIDSIFIEGNVNHLMTGAPSDDILVGLYPVEDTVYLFDGAPTYFTKTDEEGYFRINNIKVGDYFLTANQDENKNLSNDSDKESYAFMADTLDLSVSVSDIKLPLYRQDIRPIEMLNSRTSGKYFEVKYNKYVTDYSLDSSDSLISTLIDENRSIRFYDYQFDHDSLQTFITAIDSLGHSTVDTVMVKFEETKRDYDKFKFSTTLDDDEKVNEDLSFDFNFNKPIRDIFYDSLFFQYDSAHILQLDSSHIQWNPYRTKATFTVKLDSTLFYQLKMARDTVTQEIDEEGQPRKKSRSSQSMVKFVSGPATFISIEEDSTDLLIRRIDFKKRDQLGTLKGTVTTEYNSFTLQLVDKKFNVIAELQNTRNYEFKEIEPGKYFIRVLIDANENGIWEKGNILKGIEPEPVFIYDKELPIRANWEIGGEDFGF